MHICLFIVYFFIISNFTKIDQNGIFPLVNVVFIINPIITLMFLLSCLHICIFELTTLEHRILNLKSLNISMDA